MTGSAAGRPSGVITVAPLPPAAQHREYRDFNEARSARTIPPALALSGGSTVSCSDTALPASSASALGGVAAERLFLRFPAHQPALVVVGRSGSRDRAF